MNASLPLALRACIAMTAVTFALDVPAVGAEAPAGLVMSIGSEFGHTEEDQRLVTMELGKSYAVGIHRFKLDHRTEVLGWRLSEKWYFGRQRGDDSGLTLVWQQQRNQVSLSRDGVRVTHRF
jgi:hypothetical protein